MKTKLQDTAATRKKIPIYSGVIAYFPRALAEIAIVSRMGSGQHHPNQPIHWDKSKSSDHTDCLMRHLTDHARGDTIDTDGMLHLAKCAWRALAALEIELEKLKK